MISRVGKRPETKIKSNERWVENFIRLVEHLLARSRNIFHIMLTIQGFFVQFVIILQLMILYFLMEMGRALQWRVTAEVREQHAARRPQLNRDGDRRRRGGESANYSVLTNRNRLPTENDERQG